MTEDKRDSLLTIQEAADFLRVHYNTVYRRVRRGEIPASQIGTEWRIQKKDLLRYLERTKPKK